jgi:hypothetical protein
MYVFIILNVSEVVEVADAGVSNEHDEQKGGPVHFFGVVMHEVIFVAVSNCLLVHQTEIGLDGSFKDKQD